MAADLGAGPDEVQRAADAVLHFWFEELLPEQHFAKNDALDAAIRERFGALRNAVVATDAEGWRDTPERLLAAILLVDQFSRNLYRGSGAAFAADPLGLELALSGIAAGFAPKLESPCRAFLYMPLMHSEDRGVQRFALRCFSETGLEANLAFAQAHADVIERFGRFPSRNVALGRDSTREELAYLSQPGAGW
ncbi:DUF924 family protein [Sphingomonas desiccabilis]|uniref:DUF924 domain-containing protein n=1 Tax=Sphingomonas desiccabilis TaxID=429134 RepID=A0A4Q2IZ13_9SPHN|nr:DUF924 family protein [Sphingomonas desiccabilis]MBB3909897.1 uncharacterized protein (DUF924 family) [Sphingomonas desiccabilis]RXZ34570.1 DUF924 domain-containing protein [Sphingomonas desiccabilis]